MAIDTDAVKQHRRRSSSLNVERRKSTASSHKLDDGTKHRRHSSILGRPTTTNLSSPPEPPKLYTVPRHSPFGALLSRTLPNYTGKYDVGVCDMEFPVPRQTFGTFKYKNMPGSDVAGIAMDTVMFSLFYPCEHLDKPKGVAWFPK